MDQRTDNTIKRFIASAAEQNPGLIAAYIFGSYAKNLQRMESDIDVALIIDNLSDINKFDVQMQLLLLASKFDSMIEPHPISSNDFISNNPFVQEIIKTGIEIKPDISNF